jgi:hypothetical protein
VFFHRLGGHLKIKSPHRVCYTFTYITFFIRSIVKSTRRWMDGRTEENNEE